MAKILIISGNLRDWKKNSGGKERTATLAEAVAEAGHEVTFLSFNWYGPEINEKLKTVFILFSQKLKIILKDKENILFPILQKKIGTLFLKF